MRGLALAGLNGELVVEAAISQGLQGLFLSDFTIDLLLEPTHLLLQLTNEIHHRLTDTQPREVLIKGEEMLSSL